MPVYVFQKRNEEPVEHFATIAESDALLAKMYSKGFHQVYSAYKPIVQLSFQEALEETDGLLEQADRGEGMLVGADIKRKDDWQP